MVNNAFPGVPPVTYPGDNLYDNGIEDTFCLTFHLAQEETEPEKWPSRPKSHTMGTRFSGFLVLLISRALPAMNIANCIWRHGRQRKLENLIYASSYPGPFPSRIPF